MYQRGYAAAERALKREPLSIDWAEAPKNTAIAKVALFWVTEDNLMLGRKDLVSIEKPVNGADND
jgi:predicted chitinase